MKTQEYQSQFPFLTTFKKTEKKRSIVGKKKSNQTRSTRNKGGHHNVKTKLWSQITITFAAFTQCRTKNNGTQRPFHMDMGFDKGPYNKANQLCSH